MDVTKLAVPKIDVTETSLEGVLLIKPPKVMEDSGGAYVQLYNRQHYGDARIDIQFIQEDISVSPRHVLRGIHGDTKTWKLASCLQGRFYLAVVNWDEASPQFGKWESFVLSDQNRLQVLIPPKFGNGHLVLSEQAIFHYRQSAYYDRDDQFTLVWNDPKLNIWWPSDTVILSQRDEGLG